jgi:NADPH:quinone reductase-like Zn-dependent oxidoreductase
MSLSSPSTFGELLVFRHLQYLPYGNVSGRHRFFSASVHMKAAVYRRYGPPEVVTIEEVPPPEPAADEVLVRVRATTVSAGDARLRSARVPPGFALLMRLGFGISGPRKPILGWDFSGEVAALGSSASRAAVGDRVFGTRMGSHAEYVAVPQGNLAPMPATLRFEEAAALVFGGMASLFYLRNLGKIQPGERVLINGASGAVGTAAVQLARHFGATVTGVCSAGNAELVRSLGAERTIDYAKEDFTQTGETYDIILDAVGNCTFARCKRALSPGGRLLLVVASLGQIVGSVLRRSRDARQVLAGVAVTRTEDLRFLGALAESAALKPVIDRTYPLSRIRDAHTYVDTGRKKGSVVITLS